MNTSATKTTVTKQEQEGGNGVTELTIHQAMVNSPYPPPQVIVQYNETIPELGNKLVELIDRENTHRHEMERQSLVADIELGKAIASNERLEIWGRMFPRILGLLFAFLLCTFVIIFGAWLIHDGKELPGAILGSGGLAGLAWAFTRSHENKPQQPTKPKQQRGRR